MSKYIDADRLRAEIERLKSQSDGYGKYFMDKIIAYIDSLQQEHPQVADASKMEQVEVDLDALVNEAFDKYSTVDGYGQIAVSFNRAELYSFIKKFARKEE